MSERLRHIRRPSQMQRRGWWLIRCDCGWKGKVSSMAGPAVKPGKAVEAELNQLFIDHLKPSERSLYLLVDQRQVTIDGEDGEPQSVATGNFVMPEGRPCVLTSWHEADGVVYANYLEPAVGATGTLPVGEIRTADNRVLKLDAPA